MNYRFLVVVFFFWIFPSKAQTKFFTSFDTVKIGYTDEGDGKPILLLHGFINTKKNWDKSTLKKELLRKGYRVIVPDLRGNGESEKPQNDEAYRNDAEVKDIIRLMDHLGIKKYKVVGYSRGSIVLAKLLTRDKRIKKAVLGGMGIDFTNPDWDRRIQFAAAFTGKTTPMTQGAVDYAKSIHADLRSLHLQQKYQPVTSINDLMAVKAKVLVIAGDEDVDNGNPSELQKAFRRSKLAIVKGDHNNTYKTAAFAAAIISFL